MITIKSIMVPSFSRTGPILLSLGLSCAVLAAGQSSSATPTVPGAMSSSGSASNGFGSVDYSVSAGVTSTVSSAVNGAVLNSQSARSGGGSGRGSAVPSMSGTTAGESSMSSAAGYTPPGGAAGRTSQGTHGTSLTTAAGSKQALRSGLSVSSSQASALESAMKGNRLESSLAAQGASGTGLRRSSAAEQTQLKGPSGSQEGGGAYADGFPDSTRNTGGVSPPDPGTSLFVFDTSFGRGFPDLADYQFLRTSFRVAGRGSSGAQDKEDLYRKIEDRLKEYRDAEKPKKQHKTEQRTSSSAFGSSYSSKSTSVEDKLNKRLNHGGLSY